MEDTKENGKIEICEETLKYLNSIRKWSMFFSILGFIATGLLIIVGLVAGIFLLVFDNGPALLGIPEWSVIAIILSVTVLFSFPLIYLYRFSKYSGIAVKNMDPSAIRTAFRNLKRYCVFIGILIIIVLIAYFIIFLASGASIAGIRDFGTAI
jgi:hypothetical protein